MDHFSVLLLPVSTFRMHITLETGSHPALYIKQQPNQVHGQTIQDGEMTLLQNRSQDTRITYTARGSATETKQNKGRSESTATLRPTTPKLHDNALKREHDA